METSLHRQLKQRYGQHESQFEATVGRYRIDVVTQERLIEIQHGPLAAIRRKVRDLAQDHALLVVKPIVVRRMLVRLSGRQGRVVSRRMSPKRGCILDLFDELVHFTRAFPHPNVQLDVPLVEIEEWRYPGHGRRRWRRDRDHVVLDQKLVAVQRTFTFRRARQLLELIESPLPVPFHTADLARALQRDRRFAQRVAYCLRQMEAVRVVGKQGNTLLYRADTRRSPSAA